MRPFLLLFAFSLLANVPAANADSLSATRNQNLVEVAHRVDVEVRDGLAYFKVRRTFHNYGKVAEEAQLEINLPFGAAATGLRIKGKDKWHVGELMHTDKAEELYVELTGMGPSEPKDPALLYWRWTDELALRVFPIFPGSSNTVEYTLTAPTSYSDGMHYLTYGRKPEAKNLATPVLRVRGKAMNFEIDGTAQAGKTVRLGAVQLHPVLVAQDIDNPKVLVRSIKVSGEMPWKKATIVPNIRHTWRGDIALAAVSPNGELHDLRTEDLGDSENNLSESFTFDYDGDPNGTWYLLVTDHHPLDGGTLKQWTLSAAAANARTFKDSKPASIPQPTESRAGLATIGLRTNKAKTQLRLGRVAMVADKQFGRVEIDVAERLSKLPRPLSVSFVLDASHTMDEEGIEAQLKVIDAYVSHVPWADVAIVAYGRHGHTLTKGFVKGRVLRTLRTELLAKLAPRNGSFLDRGLQVAIPQLNDRKGSKALILMTDDRLRPTWKTPSALAQLAKLPEETVVHVAEVLADGGFAIERNDEHRLFPLAKARGGVAVVASGIRESKQAELDAEALYLVRPNRIDHVKLVGFAEDTEDFLDSADEDSEVLPEGEGRRWMGSVAQAPRGISIQGQLWSKPLTYEARADQEPFNRATAGFVFSHDHHDDLTDAEQFVIASYGRVVSPVTSYLAIEPGVRPSTIGLESQSMSGGVGFGSGSGSGGFATHGTPMNWGPITAKVKRACAKHGKGHVEANLSLQSHEIADISLGTDLANKALGTCVAETLWSAVIPRSPQHPLEWGRKLQFNFGN